MTFIKNSILFSKNLHSLLKNDPFTICDIGARGYLTEPWRSLQKINSDVIKVFGFEPDKTEYEMLSTTDKKGTYFPFIVWNEEKKIPFHIGKNPSTSSVHPPNLDYLKKYYFKKNWEPRETKEKIELTSKPLDLVFNKNQNEIDFIKIDTQGSEFEILQGSQKILDKQCFGVQFEAWTIEAHKGQHLFYDINKFMNDQGFIFFDLKIGGNWKMKCLEPNLKSKGQVTMVSFLYFKDPELFFQNNPSFEKIVKSIAIADVWGYPEFGIKLIDIYNKKFSDKKLDFLMSEIFALRKKNFLDQLIEKFIPPTLLERINIGWFGKPSFPNVH